MDRDPGTKEDKSGSFAPTPGCPMAGGGTGLARGAVSPAPVGEPPGTRHDAFVVLIVVKDGGHKLSSPSKPGWMGL